MLEMSQNKQNWVQTDPNSVGGWLGLRIGLFIIIIHIGPSVLFAMIRVLQSESK